MVLRKAIHKLSEYLSFQVRNIAKELVDAFDLPDHVTTNKGTYCQAIRSLLSVHNLWDSNKIRAPKKMNMYLQELISKFI
ncbi:putative acyl-CoA oxidase [Medicago truncatula]|uniref:Putative acyl-CoA oxidase n=1 Tax=Medicago truncatula TaxID=3880 RepID=A0A396IAA9_MEDTR|nr:putative acyl-CoA oxidase [Medicago truncatula]